MTECSILLICLFTGRMDQSGSFCRWSRKVLNLKANTHWNKHFQSEKKTHLSLLLSMSSAWAAKTYLLSAQSWKRKWQLQHFTAHNSVRSKVSKEENTERKNPSQCALHWREIRNNKKTSLQWQQIHENTNRRKYKYVKLKQKMVHKRTWLHWVTSSQKNT